MKKGFPYFTTMGFVDLVNDMYCGSVEISLPRGISKVNHAELSRLLPEGHLDPWKKWCSRDCWNLNIESFQARQILDIASFLKRKGIRHNIELCLTSHA